MIFKPPVENGRWFSYAHFQEERMRKLLFFPADWCPPCRFVEREFISPLERLVGKEKIIRVDAQSDQLTSMDIQVL